MNECECNVNTSLRCWI